MSAPASKRTTVKKSTSSRSTSRPAPRPRTDTPAGVSFNFDTWKRDEEVEPFVIVIGGKRYTSLDPALLDYRELEEAGEQGIEEQFAVLFPDDIDDILANKIPLGALATFNRAVFTHFGMEDFAVAQS